MFVDYRGHLRHSNRRHRLFGCDLEFQSQPLGVTLPSQIVLSILQFFILIVG
jgi:hypothetical protein